MSYPYNIFNNLREQSKMKKHNTFFSISGISEELIEKNIPFDVFSLIWENIDEYDRIIYGNESLEHVYIDYVTRGSYKRYKNKNKGKLGKSIRIGFLYED